MRHAPSALTASLATVALLSACSAPNRSHDSRSEGTSVAGAGHTEEQKRNLANFDDLDFRVYSGQKWDEFPKSHAPDIVVHYPDGSTTTGLAPHIERLKPQFAFAPDTAIREHPIKLADGDYTAVQGIMEGTFSKPMNLGDGNVIQPTARSLSSPWSPLDGGERGHERRMALLGQRSLHAADRRGAVGFWRWG